MMKINYWKKIIKKLNILIIEILVKSKLAILIYDMGIRDWAQSPIPNHHPLCLEYKKNINLL